MTIARHFRRVSILAAAVLIATISLAPGSARGQGLSSGAPAFLAGAATAAPQAAAEPLPPSMQPESPTVDDSIEAAEADQPNPPKRRFVKWNQFEGPFSTFKFGMNAMYDAATYSQDDTSKSQVGDLGDSGKWRDFRLLASGRFPWSKRGVTWKTGYMYDGVNQQWLWRETGFTIPMPEIWGHLFLGRTKEGFSLLKHTSGAAMGGLERYEILDATIPIMADGIRWMGYLPKQELIWNLGLFNETMVGSRHYPYYDHQYVLRIAWLPLVSEKGAVLHLGLDLRYGDPTDNKTQLKSRPESNTAPYFLDTGVFPARHTEMIGPEVFYRKGSFSVLSEYYWMKTLSEHGDHSFQGGGITASYILTGEVRPYVTRGGTLGFLFPKETIFEGGPGAVEATLALTYTDTDSGSIQGGRFWRISPMLGWYLADELRLTVGYGYGELDRFGKRGATQFYQSRLQLMF
jgi:phosphate-selective porin OprO/OprP